MAVSLHSGHERSDEVARLQNVDDQTRWREEDPYTEQLTQVAPNRVVVTRSRFEVDLNRPRDRCVYLAPANAWGLTVWRSQPPQTLVDAARDAHDCFYSGIRALLDDLAKRHGKFVVLDIHSYCHRRNGPDADPDVPELNPEINIGSSSVDVEHFGALLDRFIDELQRFDFKGRALDVRENVRFGGGYFPRWVNSEYTGRGCAITVEIKKFFMDEWTGELDESAFSKVQSALASTVEPILSWLS